MGSIGAAALIAKWTFVAVLSYGYLADRIGRKAVTVFAILGAAAYLGLPYLPNGAAFVTSALALIDVALVPAVFKGDVRIT